MQESNPLYDSEKYYKQRERFEKTLLSKLSLSKRQKIYPILRTIIKVRNKLNGYKIKCIGDKRTQTDKPKIFGSTPKVVEKVRKDKKRRGSACQRQGKFLKQNL